MHNQNIDFLSIVLEKFDITKIDQDYLIWYILYCHAAIDIEATEQTENHHILPSKLFPEFENLNRNQWNSSRLKLVDHFYAHYLLAKAIKSKSTRFAFNMMRRSFKEFKLEQIQELALLYAEFREQLSKDFSSVNKGRVQSAHSKKVNSEKQKNCVIVRPKDSPINSKHFKTSIFDPEYLNGNLVVNATGTTKSIEARKLMSENGIKGKEKYHNPITGESIYVRIDEIVPENFIKGETENFKIGAAKKFTDSLFYHNPITKEQKRFKINSEVPDGWIMGKIFFGEEGNNFSNYTFYINHLTGTKGKLKPGESLPKYCARPTSKSAYIIANYVTFNIETAMKITGFTKGTIILIKEHPFNTINTKTRDAAIRKFIGLRYLDLGVEHTPIKKFFERCDYVNYTFL
jgi:hypothetical protein